MCIYFSTCVYACVCVYLYTNSFHCEWGRVLPSFMMALFLRTCVYMCVCVSTNIFSRLARLADTSINFLIPLTNRIFSTNRQKCCFSAFMCLWCLFFCISAHFIHSLLASYTRTLLYTHHQHNHNTLSK